MQGKLKKETQYLITEVKVNCNFKNINPRVCFWRLMF